MLPEQQRGAEKAPKEGEWKTVRNKRHKVGEWSLFVGNLGFDITEDDLRKRFGQFGDLSDVYIPNATQFGRNRGYALVRFQRKGEALIVKECSMTDSWADEECMSTMLSKGQPPTPPPSKDRNPDLHLTIKKKGGNQIPPEEGEQSQQQGNPQPVRQNANLSYSNIEELQIAGTNSNLDTRTTAADAFSPLLNYQTLDLLPPTVNTLSVVQLKTNDPATSAVPQISNSPISSELMLTNTNMQILAQFINQVTQHYPSTPAPWIQPQPDILEV
ncbi:uncharacterized protein LOC131234583 [Magnolia sinica]|uniref:uncharacterized protein LOC131234583 n=1 Tax=Magnolia sinica TaxID=86752 RepID=UPI0026593688|nr:uncharacterized protein LOC131234583 [Magnolia sinica]